MKDTILLGIGFVSGVLATIAFVFGEFSPKAFLVSLLQKFTSIVSK